MTDHTAKTPNTADESSINSTMNEEFQAEHSANLTALRTLGRAKISTHSDHEEPNVPEDIEILPLDEEVTLTPTSTSTPTPLLRPPDSRGISVQGYSNNPALKEAQAPKYKDNTIHEDDNPNAKIIAYYNPKSLSPEYAKPELVKISWSTNIPLVNGVPFWERLPEEPTPYYEAFCHYRDQDAQAAAIGEAYIGVRLLHRTANFFGIEPSLLEEVAELWMWPQRVATYEEFASLLVEQKRAKKIKVMESDHMEIAHKLRAKAMEAFENLDPDRLTPNQMREWIKFSTELERLAVGLPEHEPPEGNPSDNKRNNNGGGPSVELSGENQKVQIIFDKNWQSI